MWSTSIRIPRMAWTILNRSVDGCSTPILVFKTRPFEAKFKIFKQYTGKQTVRNEQFAELKNRLKTTEAVTGWTKMKKQDMEFHPVGFIDQPELRQRHFPAKRRVIIGKDQGKRFSLPTIDENGEIVLGSAENGSSSFIPPCTKYVFLKYYNTASFDPNAWTKDDAEAYKNNIIEVLKDFLS